MLSPSSNCQAFSRACSRLSNPPASSRSVVQFILVQVTSGAGARSSEKDRLAPTAYHCLEQFGGPPILRLAKLRSQVCDGLADKPAGHWLGQSRVDGFLDWVSLVRGDEANQPLDHDVTTPIAPADLGRADRDRHPADAIDHFSIVSGSRSRSSTKPLPT
jgi:hypothetical protein